MIDIRLPLSRLLLRLRREIRVDRVTSRLGFCLIIPMFASSAIAQAGYYKALEGLQSNRDRLLTQYAQERGFSSASQIWATMTPSQQGVFLTITDLLGRRSYMNEPRYDYQLIRGLGRDMCPENLGSTDCNEGGCWIKMDDYTSVCTLVESQTCVETGRCSATPARDEWDMALNHVQKFYAINGGGSSCGGSSNRIFFKANPDLMYKLRNIWLGLPIWNNSGDPAGPHSPFTQSRETWPGQPRGQTHQWAWDYEASYLFRENFVSSVYDPSVVEIDIDYNWIHDSNPECYYDGTRGRNFYENYWQNHGLGGSAELNYIPTN